MCYPRSYLWGDTCTNATQTTKAYKTAAALHHLLDMVKVFQGLLLVTHKSTLRYKVNDLFSYLQRNLIKYLSGLAEESAKALPLIH